MLENSIVHLQTNMWDLNMNLSKQLLGFCALFFRMQTINKNNKFVDAKLMNIKAYAYVFAVYVLCVPYRLIYYAKAHLRKHFPCFRDFCTNFFFLSCFILHTSHILFDFLRLKLNNTHLHIYGNRCNMMNTRVYQLDRSYNLQTLSLTSLMLVQFHSRFHSKLSQKY